jgi:hypothetical protein
MAARSRHVQPQHPARPRRGPPPLRARRTQPRPSPRGGSSRSSTAAAQAFRPTPACPHLPSSAVARPQRGRSPAMARSPPPCAAPPWLPRRVRGAAVAPRPGAASPSPPLPLRSAASCPARCARFGPGVAMAGWRGPTPALARRGPCAARPPAPLGALGSAPAWPWRGGAARPLPLHGVAPAQRGPSPAWLRLARPRVRLGPGVCVARSRRVGVALRERARVVRIVFWRGSPRPRRALLPLDMPVYP